VGFNNEDEVDLFDLNAGTSKSEDYSVETNMFAIEYDVPPDDTPADSTQTAPPPAPTADDEDVFDLSGAVPAPIETDDADEFPVEKEGFFSKLKRIFVKPAEIEDIDDGLPEPDDDKPVLEKSGDDDDVFDLDSSVVAPAPAAATLQTEPEPEEFGAAKADIEAEEPEPEVFEAVKAEIEAAKSEPEVFEAVKVEIEAVESEPEVFEAVKAEIEAPAAEETKPPEDDEEFDFGANVPPPAPAPMPPPVFNKIAHVCLYVKNLDASVDFYTKLGFTKRFTFNKNGGRFGVYLEFGSGNFIELFEDTSLDPGGAAAHGRLAHFCLESPDIDAAMESLTSRGIEYTPKKLGCDSTYQIWLKDPDGNEFEIHQYTPESSQIVGRDVDADW